MNNSIYNSFTKDELVQRCIDLATNRVAMLADKKRLTTTIAQLEACNTTQGESINEYRAELLAAYVELRKQKLAPPAHFNGDLWEAASAATPPPCRCAMCLLNERAKL